MPTILPVLTRSSDTTIGVLHGSVNPWLVAFSARLELVEFALLQLRERHRCLTICNRPELRVRQEALAGIEPRSAVATRGDDHIAGRRPELSGPDRVRVPAEDGDKEAGVGIPDPSCLVVTRSDGKLAVRAEGDVVHGSSVSAEDEQLVAVGGVE